MIVDELLYALGILETLVLGDLELHLVDYVDGQAEAQQDIQAVRLPEADEGACVRNEQNNILCLSG
jgi:hypothetical protein